MLRTTAALCISLLLMATGVSAECTTSSVAGTYAATYFGLSGPPFTPVTPLPVSAVMPMAYEGLLTLNPNGTCTFGGHANIGGLIFPPAGSPGVPLAANCTFSVQPDCIGEANYDVRFELGGQLIEGRVAERFLVWDGGREIRSISQRTGIPGTSFWGTLRRLYSAGASAPPCGTEMMAGTTLFQCTGFHPILPDPANLASAHYNPAASVLRVDCSASGSCLGAFFLGVQGGGASLMLNNVSMRVASDCTVAGSYSLPGPGGLQLNVALNGVLVPQDERVFLINSTPGTGVAACEGRPMK